MAWRAGGNSRPRLPVHPCLGTKRLEGASRRAASIPQAPSAVIPKRCAAATSRAWQLAQAQLRCPTWRSSATRWSLARRVFLTQASGCSRLAGSALETLCASTAAAP